MLKLKRDERDRHIQVLIRDQGNFLTRSFVVAFSLALGIHLLAVTLFHIAPFKLRFEETLPPIQVESVLTIAQDERMVVATLDRDLVPLGFYLEPGQSIPALPKPPPSSSFPHLDYMREDSIQSNPFAGLENDLLLSSFFTIERSPSPHVPIELSMNGALAEKELVDNGMSEQILESVKSIEGQFRSIFSVQVKDDIGRIFWIEPKQLAGLDVLDKLAEQILLEMKFRPTAETFVTAGEVEVTFHSKFTTERQRQ
jgi:hypothetical protein